jgi:hypothetical protein
MIPRDILANLYLKLFHAEIKRGGRTVRNNRADRPAAPGGLSARAARTVRVARGKEVSGTALGVPLSNGGKPHLKPATKPKYVKPNHAGE